jgi:hypothetical protein
MSAHESSSALSIPKSKSKINIQTQLKPDRALILNIQTWPNQVSSIYNPNSIFPMDTHLFVHAKTIQIQTMKEKRTHFFKPQWWKVHL